MFVKKIGLCLFSFLMLIDYLFGENIEIFKEIEIKPGKEVVYEINLPNIDKDKELILELKARIKSERIAATTWGNNYCLKLFLNGTELKTKDLVDREESFSWANGKVIFTYGLAGYYVYYAPDFNPIPENLSVYPIGINPFLFRFKITPLAMQGKNILKIRNSWKATNPIILADAKIITERVKKEEKQEERMTKETITFIAPKEVKKVSYVTDITLGGAIKVSIGKETYIITSHYSFINGWAELKEKESSNFKKIKVDKTTDGYNLFTESKNFILERKVIEKEEAIEVIDKLTNKTGDFLPIRVKHQTYLPQVDKVYLNGLVSHFKKGDIPHEVHDIQNPTTICITSNGSLGFLPLDDVFRVHIQNFANSDFYGIADNNLVLKPKSSIILRFAIFPSLEKDYYSQINAMRRYLGVNFEIPGSFCFIHPWEPGIAWPEYGGREHPNINTKVDDLRRYLINKGVKFACSTIGFSKYKGKHPHGTAFQVSVDRERYIEFFNKLKEAVPEIKTMIYFQSFIDVLDEGPQKYSDSKILRQDGSHAYYGSPIYPLYFPTIENSYGKEIAKNIDIILDEIKADGIYWDEMEYSGTLYHYGEPWDGVSADIDPQTNEILRLKSYYSSYSTMENGND